MIQLLHISCGNTEIGFLCWLAIDVQYLLFDGPRGHEPIPGHEEAKQVMSSLVRVARGRSRRHGRLKDRWQHITGLETGRKSAWKPV